MPRDAERILDEYLVAAALTGDASAWDRLVARWQPRLLRHAWRLLGDPERARDAVQEGWVEIWRGLGRLDDVVAFPAWALRIVTRRCQRGFARRDRERELAEQMHAENAPEAGAGVDDGGEQAVDLALVMRALQQLPPPQRSALALFYLENLSVAEVAIAMDVPPGTVKTRLMHARRKIRAQLEGKGDEQT